MDMKTIGIIVLVAAFAALIYVEVQKRSTFAKLEHYMAERDFDNYLAVLDRPVTNILYPEYNRLFLRLNAYLGMGDNENTARVLDKMMTLRMSKEQKLALAIKGFSFFVDVEDKPKAERMLAILEEDGGEEVARASRQTFDIFLCGSSAYVDEMERELKDASKMDQARLYYLLSLQYENRGDSEKSKEYAGRAEKALEAALK